MPLHYIESGNPDGEIVIFLHGAGLASWSWQDVTHYLTDYRCIAVDLPGHGNSNQVQASSLAEMTDITANFIKRLTSPSNVHLVGISLGGIITTEIIRRYPHLIYRAVVSGVNAIPLPVMTRMLVNFTMLFVKNDFMIRQNARMFQLDEEASQAYYESMKQLDLPTLKAVMSEILSYAPSTQVDKANVPTLFVAGGNEQAINVDSVKVLSQVVEHSIGAIVPNVGHAWSVEDPKLFASMIQQWIEETEVVSELEVVIDNRQKLEVALV